ncbi:RraA family protein [Bacillus sp. Cr_A10]|uniref:RraA family protein n=1 Tax=Bacillaceae TaxID=186817 RepID=UPI0023DC8745|nr:RraA family protein [Bacillus sp. Cr_A10]MDF2066912.1 RraA family protein [Bacillus sp. Cr_A10]
MIETNKPTLLPDYIIERASKLNSTLLSDAMGCTGGMDYQIKPVTSKMKVVGTAVTLTMRPTDNLFLHKAIYDGSEGYVLVADGKGDTTHAYMGELMARAAKAVGLEGIVIDGAIRDREELENLGLPIFSKGFVPNGPLKDGPGTMNTSVTCGGIIVNPGDLIVGDADGVTVVPRDQIEEVFIKAEKKFEYEKKRIEAINDFEEKRKRGEIPNSLAPDWLDEKLKKFGY